MNIVSRLRGFTKRFTAILSPLAKLSDTCIGVGKLCVNFTTLSNDLIVSGFGQIGIIKESPCPAGNTSVNLKSDFFQKKGKAESLPLSAFLELLTDYGGHQSLKHTIVFKSLTQTKLSKLSEILQKTLDTKKTDYTAPSGETLPPSFSAKNSTSNLDQGVSSFSLDTVAQMNIVDVPLDVFTQYLTKQLKRSTRLTERLENKKLIIKRLKKFGFIKEAENLKKCSANFTALVCENGHSFRPIVDYRCHLSFCADCCELKSHRELSRILPKFLQALKDDESLIVALATLTLKSDNERGLRDGCKQLKTDFKALRRRDIWENCVGGFGRIENTFSKNFRWHPHIHNLLLLKDYIPQKDLSADWNDITGDSMIVDIRTVYDLASGLVECIKYPLKPSDLLKLGKAEIQEMIDIKGARLGVSFGVLFGLEVEEDIEESIADEYSEFVEETNNLEIGDSCPICQTKLDLIDFSSDGYISFLSSVSIHSPPTAIRQALE